ncbi:RILP-like protein 1 [Amphiura filiformis]|uniref:RILP-like protein 1 n=1 Tax=Amphiura filiformis TaxID=82378 RepID=UPI003B226F13
MGDLSVLNVYETAAVIGREVEVVIAECGSDAIASLMTHVIKVLEQLEALVTQKEQDKVLIERLEEDIVFLRSDGIRKNEDNLKLQTDIQQLEELIKSEEIDLMNTADKIQRENRQLKEQLTEKHKLVASEMVQEQETIKVLNQMKETVDKQRDDLRRQNAELRAKTEELEALQQQVERYFKINSDLHRKNQLHQEYAKNLIHEKSQLQSQIAGLEQDQTTTARELANAEVQGQGEGEVTADVTVKGKETLVCASTSSRQSEGTDVDRKNMQWVNLEGKMIIDKKDPNRPRFTLKEMAHVLEERDNIKMRIMELEDEIEAIQGPKEKSLELSTPDKKLIESTRERSDSSGIKRFFSGILKKLSPQKKPSPGYQDGKWEVLDPTNHDLIISTEADCYETSTPSGRLSAINDLEVEDAEEVRMELFPDKTAPLLADSGLRKDSDPEYFTNAASRQRKRLSLGDINGENDECKNGVKAHEEEDRTENLPGNQTQGAIAAAAFSAAVVASNIIDVNGNDDKASSSSETRPHGCNDNEEEDGGNQGNK